MVERAAIGGLGPPTRAAGDVVERAQHRGHVTQRRPMSTAGIRRTERLALEVDDAKAIGRQQQLTEVVVAVRADDLRGRRECVEHGQGLGDPRGEFPQGRAGLVCSGHIERRLEVRPGVAGPRTDLVARRLARRHVRQPVAIRQRCVEAGRQRPEVGRHFGRVLDAQLAGCRRANR